MQSRRLEKFFYLITKPGRFFAHALLEQKIGWASAFLLVVVLVFCLVRVVSDPSLPPYLMPATFVRYVVAFSVLSFAVNSVYAFSVTLIGKKFGGKATFRRVYIVGAYSSAPLILCATTYTALFGIVWAFCLAVSGLKIAQGFPARRASVLQASFVAILTLVIGLGFFALSTLNKRHYPAERLLNKPAPNVVLKRFDGTEIKLADLKGQVVFLDFWATWCVPCRDSMPALSELSKQFKRRGLMAYAIADDNVQDAKDYLQAYKIDLLDVQGSTDLDKAFFVEGLPECVVIDKDGIVRGIHCGVSPREMGQVRCEIESCLSDTFK